VDYKDADGEYISGHLCVKQILRKIIHFNSSLSSKKI